MEASGELVRSLLVVTCSIGVNEWSFSRSMFEVRAEVSWVGHLHIISLAVHYSDCQGRTRLTFLIKNCPLGRLTSSLGGTDSLSAAATHKSFMQFDFSPSAVLLHPGPLTDGDELIVWICLMQDRWIIGMVAFSVL